MDTTIMHDLKILTEQTERLVIENGLLRKASEEQRELNGQLRVQLQYKDAFKTSVRNWDDWYQVWSILLDGSCYNEAQEHYNFALGILKVTDDDSEEQWDCQP